MQNRLNPVRSRHRLALSVRNGDQGRLRESLEHRMNLRQIESAVQRCQERHIDVAEYRERQIVQMEMQHVKTISDPPHLFQHQEMRCIRVTDCWVEAQSGWPRRFELRPGD